MPRVTFTENFDWHPDPKVRRVVVAFKKGSTHLVTRACAAAAVHAKRAVYVKAPKAEAGDERRG